MLQIIKLLVLTLMLSSSISAYGDEGHEETLDISNVWARKTGKRTVSAAVYFDVHNRTHLQETLTGVSTDRAAISTLHRSFSEDNIMHMEMQDDVPIAPNEKLMFAPGGYHVMLLNLIKPLEEGDVFPMTLSFKNAGDVTVYVEVTGIAGPVHSRREN